jgi:hypothetical protein
LLVFRVLYFVIPFGTAISIMGTRELWMNVVVPWQQRRKLSCAPQAPASASAPTPLPQRVKRVKSRG